eukprot:CAMPEP_0202705236 /NCGR_PEP_ID=MMETSP1385-20130828/17820_1 /ASSEMBLY_ACC=CAM_ASM_000861 /TAXON_ID=933848 /ORGANISM="Elphidium margaritaceum" /LENGTH=122 /DNA_ID=CAMNT_0049363431 /DNA_START=276 /DNA_END=644 /DNA_ORIENTATION=+
MTKRWRIQIKRSSWTVVGIIESHLCSRNLVGNFYDQHNNGYGLKGMDGRVFHSGNRPDWRDEPLCMLFSAGDDIEMTLNMNDGSLSYRINETSYPPSFFVDINQEFSLCCALCKDAELILLK